MPKRAAGRVIVEGDANAKVPKGAALVRGDGARYVVTADATVAKDESVEVDVEAVEDGDAFACGAGETLTFAPELEGLDAPATVATTGVGTAPDEKKPKGGKPDEKKSPPPPAAAPAKKQDVRLRVVVNGSGLVALPCTSARKTAKGWSVVARLHGRELKYDALPEFDVTLPHVTSVEILEPDGA